MSGVARQCQCANLRVLISEAPEEPMMMTKNRATTHLFVLIGVLTISACSNIPTRIHDSGVRIEPISNDTANIRSAAFWRDRDGLSLRGEFSAKPINEDSLIGHIDISITVPDGSNTVCTTTVPDTDSKQAFKPFAHRFESLPPRGSLLRVWHHPAPAPHDDCVS